MYHTHAMHTPEFGILVEYGIEWSMSKVYCQPRNYTPFLTLIFCYLKFAGEITLEYCKINWKSTYFFPHLFDKCKYPKYGNMKMTYNIKDFIKDKQACTE